MELYAEPLIQQPTFEDLARAAQEGVLVRPRIVGTLSMSPDGLVVLGERNIVLDAPNRRILINDGTNDRILIGYQLNGF